MARPKKEKPNRSDNRYEVKITIGHNLSGKAIRKSFYSDISAADARRKADEYKLANAVSNITGMPLLQNKNITFEEWALEWLEKYKHGSVKENTYKNTYAATVKKDLIPYFGIASINTIMPKDIQLFINNKKNVSPSKMHKIKICLNAIFDTAIDNNICVRNPAKNISFLSNIKSSEKRTYTALEKEKVLEYSKSHKNGLAVILMLELGLRRGELLALRWSDFDFKNRTVSISRAVFLNGDVPAIGETKTANSRRVLPLSKELSKYLSSLNIEDNGLIFKNKLGKVKSPHNWRTREYIPFMKELSKEINVPALNPHELRHTCGTLLYNKTKNIYAVSKYLGHATVEITAKIYVHNDLETFRESLKIDDTLTT